MGDVVCGEDHARRTYAYCGAGQWRDVLTGQAYGRHQLSEGLRLLVRRGFAVCDRHWLGELLDADAVEPLYGSVVVTDDGIAHIRGDSGGWESNGNMPMTWDDLLAGAGTVRLVHWDPVADRSRGGCQDPG